MLHGLIALLVSIYRPVAMIYGLGTMAYFLFIIIKKQNKNHEVLIAAAYITGAEVFLRMTKGTISWEMSKYAVTFFLFLGLVFKGPSNRAYPYWLYLFFLVPGILFSAINLDYETNVRKAIIFNLIGPICLGFSALYCFYTKVTLLQIKNILIALLMPIVATTVYIYLYNPSLKDAISGTASNAAASGGFGPNQVSTILGLGMFILLTRVFIVKNKLINIIDLALLGLMTLRALGTFSRGGVFTGAVCAAAFILIYFSISSVRVKASVIPKIGTIVGALIAVWIFATIQTGGLIVNRYTNKDAAGRLKEDITTGRAELLSAELDGFKENPITGIGVGKAKEYRDEKGVEALATHNELSRLLSEHGMFGLFALGILIIVPAVYWFRTKRNPYFFSFLLFWFLTINHSSMRLVAPAFIYGLALLYVVNETKKSGIHREQLTS
ncbi:O-antigen ligase family protein [Gangjinia marincola]